MAIHSFEPAHYHTVIGAHDPVLRVADGDTIITTTVDAGGKDAAGEQVTPGGNPQTGPFYVEGAAPGDTLAVRLDRLEPNCARAYSGTVIAPNVVDPVYVNKLPQRQGAEWRIDQKAGTATLVSPDTKLGKLVLPLDPMLGCFGVAPGGGQAISTATSAEHGGNMDYPGFREGVTAYFPVSVEGALLHLGDGHAVQGDGEIVGTGIEVSMDVRVTVHVLKGKRSAGRVEKTRTASSPSGMHGPSTSASSTRPRRCFRGSKRTTVWTAAARASCWASVCSTTWAMSSTRPTQWSASWQSGMCLPCRRPRFQPRSDRAGEAVLLNGAGLEPPVVAEEPKCDT